MPTMPTRGSCCDVSPLFVLLLGLAASGCVSLDSIRERQFNAVTIEQVEAAADSADPTVHQGLVALLERRLEDPGAISLDVTLEALVSLMHLEDVDPRDIVPAVRRCATDDPNEEVRYLALDTLTRWEGTDSRATIEGVRSRDPSGLVREHASELLAEWPSETASGDSE